MKEHVLGEVNYLYESQYCGGLAFNSHLRDIPKLPKKMRL